MALTYSQGTTKAEFVAEMQAHRAADHLIAGLYFDASTGRGCGIGCGVETINRPLGLNLEYDSHAGLASALGWPVWLCGMEDRIFEGLPPLERSAWPVDLATAVPEGVDLEPALNQILARMLREVVLPAAGSSAAIVQRVANGCATNWASDDPRKARQATYYAATYDVAAAVAAATHATYYAATYATYDVAAATYADATAVAAAAAATAAAATAAVAAATYATYADATYADAVAAADAARQNTWLAIAQIVLEEVVKVGKLTTAA